MLEKYKHTLQVALDEGHAETNKKYKSERPTVVCEVCGKTTQRSEQKVHMRYNIVLHLYTDWLIMSVKS